MKAAVWKAFLPVGKPRRVHEKDVMWFAARDVNREALSGALAVLRCVRAAVVSLRKTAHLDRLMFLVHDHDGAPHIDVTLWFTKSVDLKLPRKWRDVKPAVAVEGIAGIIGINTPQAQRLICAQSAWYLDLVENYSLPDVDVLKQIGQFLHYFANMSQMVVS